MLLHFFAAFRRFFDALMPILPIFFADYDAAVADALSC